MANSKAAKVAPPAGRDPLAGLFPSQRPAGVDDLAGARSILAALIDPNPFQPRRSFDQAALNELAASIKAQGILQPLVVRKVEDRYQLVTGERRLRAAKQAGLEKVPCIVRQVEDDDLEMLALVENLQREDLEPADEARAYAGLMTRFGLTHRELAARVHKHHTYIAQRLRLIADPEVEEAVRSKTLGPTVAQELVRSDDPAKRREVLDRARRGERLKVKDVKPARGRPAGAAPAAPSGGPPARAGRDAAEAPSALAEPAGVVNNSPLLPSGDSAGPQRPQRAAAATVPGAEAAEELVTLDSLAIMRLRARGSALPRSEVVLALWADLDMLEGHARERPSRA